MDIAATGVGGGVHAASLASADRRRPAALSADVKDVGTLAITGCDASTVMAFATDIAALALARTSKHRVGFDDRAFSTLCRATCRVVERCVCAAESGSGTRCSPMGVARRCALAARVHCVIAAAMCGDAGQRSDEQAVVSEADFDLAVRRAARMPEEALHRIMRAADADADADADARGCQLSRDFLRYVHDVMRHLIAARPACRLRQSRFNGSHVLQSCASADDRGTRNNYLIWHSSAANRRFACNRESLDVHEDRRRRRADHAAWHRARRVSFMRMMHTALGEDAAPESEPLHSAHAEAGDGVAAGAADSQPQFASAAEATDAHRLAVSAPILAAGAAPKGRLLVVDWLSTAGSAEVVHMGRDAGLASRSLFDTAQLPNACGYLASAWATMLRGLGDQFTSLTREQATSVNRSAFFALQNTKLQRADPTDVIWLSGDQIIALTACDNPDAPNTYATWLSGPMPISLFRTFFRRTLTAGPGPGLSRIYICIVNTAEQMTLQPDKPSGRHHWITVAWQVADSE